MVWKEGKRGKDHGKDDDNDGNKSPKDFKDGYYRLWFPRAVASLPVGHELDFRRARLAEGCQAFHLAAGSEQSRAPIL